MKHRFYTLLTTHLTTFLTTGKGVYQNPKFRVHSPDGISPKGNYFSPSQSYHPMIDNRRDCVPHILLPHREYRVSPWYTPLLCCNISSSRQSYAFLLSLILDGFHQLGHHRVILFVGDVQGLALCSLEGNAGCCTSGSCFLQKG